MRLIWKIFRAVVSVVLLLAVVLPLGIYVVLSFDSVQDRLRAIAEKELSQLLGARIGIEKVSMRPFNKLEVRGVTLSIGSDTIATAHNISAGVELTHLMRTGELEIDYALIDGIAAHISRDSIGAPLNILPIIEHLRNDDKRESKAFELKINTVILRGGTFTYDVDSAPEAPEGRFDANHIAVNNLALNAYIPGIGTRRYCADIDHLSFDERCGFALKALQAKVNIDGAGANLDNLSIELPNSTLKFNPIVFAFNGINNIVDGLRGEPVALSTAPGSTFYPPDIAGFIPQLKDIDTEIAVALDCRASLNEAIVDKLHLVSSDGALDLALSASASQICCLDSLSFKLPQLVLRANSAALMADLKSFINSQTRTTISKAGSIFLSANGSGTPSVGNVTLKVETAAGDIAFDGDYRRHNAKTTVEGALTGTKINLNSLTGSPLLGTADVEVEGRGILYNKRIDADIDATVASIAINGQNIEGTTAKAKISGTDNIELTFNANDSLATVMAYAVYHRNGKRHSVQATASAAGVDLYALGIDTKHEGYLFGGRTNIDVSASTVNDLSGTVQFSDLRMLDNRRNGIRIPRFNLSADPSPTAMPNIRIDSNILTGTLTGHYTLTTLVPQFRTMAAHFLPAVFGDDKTNDFPPSEINDFRYSLKLLPASQQITQFFGVPFHILHDVDIEGEINYGHRYATLDVDAPYLQQGEKLIEHSYVHLTLDSAATASSIYATTKFPTKKGDMILTASLSGADDRIDTHIDWNMERAKPIGGTIDFATDIRSIGGAGTFPADAAILFNPGSITFGDDVWEIRKSTIDITPDAVTFNGFGLDAPDQHIGIDGRIGAHDTDSVKVDLRRVSIEPIFDNLEIYAALIGGRATGTVTGKNLLSKEPRLSCPNLHVDSIGYQGVPIGTADIEAKWLTDKRSVNLDANIVGFEGKRSRIMGDIMPLDNSLDIKFDADSVPVSFLQPFMKAFAADISGRGSGKFRLFGTFSDIEMEGDVKATDFRMKVAFTNVAYHTTDSVHLRPGRIILDNVVIKDDENNTARINGLVTHNHFKDPTVFRFDVSDARDMMVFNTTSKMNPDWYGTIYGSGGASIYGEPGVVNIEVGMSTAPRSTFTYVLTDRLDAADYSFITFRDVTPDSLRAQAVIIDDIPEAVRAFRRRNENTPGAASDFNMDLRVDINRDATITLVMDPASGDEIRAHGNGNLHMAYHSANDDLNIWGKYSLTDGNYRFTLQDIIIKDFTIKDGSEIQFDGDPNGVKTKLQAYYALNANLTDLDESFAQDKDIARTSVPVHALLNVSGDIRQPAIGFDLEFPTLTSDTYRKVRSIVSTEDMMNRQIIYLLALNRFYTPDYMASTTKGNELFSVASSTISSQFSNMLGKLSDKWSISPNLRSDRGDFSDVEVDVALSSRLLNNRLLLNGNLGYRDKSLNTNQFIGDFDIEYLLNPRGTWRLKAYNRYNDRNYYVRSALTTQGVGIMFRLDFDNFGSFLRRKKPLVPMPAEEK